METKFKFRKTIQCIDAAPILAVVLVLGIVFDGCNKSDDVVESLCRQKFYNAIHGFETNGAFGKDELANAFRMIVDVGDIPKRAMLLKEFEDAFFKADISHFGIRRQLAAIDSFVTASDSFRRGLSGALETDGWDVRIRTVSWVKGQLDRIKRSEPETLESRSSEARLWNEFASAWNVRSEEVFSQLFLEWMKKHPPIRRGVVKNHRAWELVANGGKDHILRPLIARCMMVLESGSCPSGLRQKRLKELESVIGGSIHDEAFWNERFRFKGSPPNIGDVEVDVEL